MGKTIIFNENSLMAIKDSLDGIKAGNDNIASPNDIYVNEAAPDVDEFTIGGEDDSPVGGVYYHTTDDNINESYGRNCLTTCDFSEVGEVLCDNWTYDEDEYQEYLVDNELEDTLENKIQYIEDNVEFDIELLDNQIYHHMDSDYVYYDDLVDAFGEKFAKNIEMGMLNDGSYKFYTEDLYEDEVYDINNPQELTDIAMKILPHGDYYQGCRGFILPNGVIVYTEGEHSDVTRIPGINDKFQFVELGNIRILQNSVDIGAEPTWQQEETLKKVIASYEGEEFYLDIFDNGSEIGAKYQNADYHYIMGEIDRFYSEGIKPQGGSFYESKKNKSMNNSHLIIESQESKSIAAAKKLVIQRLGYNEQEADEFVRIKLRNDIPSLRTPQGGKFIFGVTRMFCDGELRNANDIGSLNSTLKLVASDAHINEYDRNLNGMSAQELIQRFSKAMSDSLEAEKSEINQMVFDTPSDYEIVRIDSFEQAEEYGDYVSWCVTHDEDMFDSYTSNGINQFYFCLKNGFESVDDQPGDGCPLDEYGLSMIAVSVNENGMLNTCTCRWNHDNGGDDSIMNSKEVSQVIGMNFFDVFKPNNKWKELLANVEQRLANGEDLEDVFDYLGNFSEGFAVVGLNEKYNFINQEGKLLSGQWFGSAHDFRDGFAVVLLNRKCNFINQEGKLLSGQWFDNAYNFREGFAVVELNEKYNFINQEGKLISNQWFDYARDFINGFSIVKLNEKYNFINQEGRLISNQWFDRAHDFKNGFAKIGLNEKYNFINQEGRLISNQWFDGADNFYNGFARTMFNGKYNFINQEGKLLSDQWFDGADDFTNNGFAWVKLNEKCNFINQEGRLLSDQWFDAVRKFIYGFARVMLNGKYNFINQEGKLISDQWFDDAYNFYNGFTDVKLNGKHCRLDANGNLTLAESKKGKKVIMPENKLGIIKENYEPEVKSSEVSLSSFKKKDELAPKIWKDKDTLDSKVRLKLLDIADDFWEFVNLTWVEPKGIILTGSICNFNWSKFSDIDLHLVVDFNEIDERTDFVREYLDAKKNEWNNEHESLKIKGFQVELYVQNVDEMPESGGIYDLEENKWIRKPNKGDIKPIGLSKYAIKDKAATIMTIIDDMCDVLESTDDMYDIRQLDDDASHLWKKVKKMRTSSLEKNGEGGAGNIVYKVMRRMGYLDKLFDLRGKIYDKLNSISEATHKFKVLMIETLDENKELLKEYLDNNYGLPLYKYFKWAEKATDKEKVEDLFYHNPYIIGKYLEDVSDYDEELEELQDELCDDEDLMYDEEFVDRVINALEINGLLRRIIESAHVYAYAEELPTWMTMDFIRLVENEWCIHFTSDAYNIAREGFTGGTPEIDDLAYTGAGRQKIGAGYDFAFLIHDRSVDFNGYGDEAVIFRASGVLARHYGDEQDQVIFWGPSVKEIIPIKTSEYSGDWEIEGLDGQIFKKAEKPSELADWATDNLPQYRKQILAGKSGYKPWGFNRPPYDNEFLKTESSKINEEIVADGNAEHNPYEKRWKAERQALKDFLVNCGKIMTSKENGKQYKVYYDQTISNLIGYNYCICVQWDPIEMKPESTIYIRALDKFTNRIFQAQYDDRGKDNMRGTYDDMGYSQRFESRNTHKTLITEASNKKRAKNQTMRILAQGLGMDINSPQLASLESDFRNVYFNHIGNQEMDRVIMYEPLFAKCALDLGFGTDTYNDDDFVNYVNYLILKTKDSQNYSEIIGYYKSKISSYDDMVNVVGDEIKAKRDSEREEMANMETNVNQNYEIRGPLSFEEAHEIGAKSCPNSRICYTCYEDTWLGHSYSNNNKNKCYVLLRKDWENYNSPEMAVHDGSEKNNGLPSPLDEYNGYDNYGLSMIFVWIDPYGNLYKSNTRWNHEADYAPGHGVDMALKETDIAKLMGEPFEQVFNVEKVDRLEKIKERLANGEDPEDIFDSCVYNGYNLAVVRIDKKCNILREDNTFVWDKPIEEWFNNCSYNMSGGCFLVSIKEKYNYLRLDGTLLWKNDEWPNTSNWFDWTYGFREGFFCVRIGIGINFVKEDGTLLWKNDEFPDTSSWFTIESGQYFKKGKVAVKFGSFWYYLKSDGKLYDYKDNLVAESKISPKLLTESNNNKEL